MEAIQNIKPNWPPLDTAEEVVNESFVQGDAELGNSSRPAEELAIMPVVNFEDENGADGVKAIEFTRTLQIQYNPSDVKFWFTQLETEMETCEVKSQWLKRVVLVKNLPAKVQEDVKRWLVLQKAEAPPDLYKQIKKEILRIHAPKNEDAFKKALSRVLVALPSQLGATLINDICDQPTKLEGCCCAKIVRTLWTMQLPLGVRSFVANMDFTAQNYNDVFQAADKVFLSTKDTEVSPAVAAVTLKDKKSGGANPSPEVAAVQPSKNKGGGSSGNNKAGKPNSSSSSSSSSNRRGKKHSSNPPSSVCDNHYKFGDQSWHCLSPFTCPWKDRCVRRPEKNSESK